MMKRIAVVVLALLAGTLTAPGALSAPPDDGCAPVMPVASVRPGMTGTGYTVAEGTTRETFGVEVLGVQEDAVGVGRDLVIVELSGPVIDRVGGPWFGISGSPVYIGDQLLGATAYLVSGSSSIAGVTPAEDMVELLAAPAEAATRLPQRLALDADSVAAVAEATGRTPAEVGAARLTAPTVPLAISGLTPRRVAALREALGQRGVPYLPYAAGSAGAAGTTGFATLRPGDNLAAVLSYGDVTQAAIGTATHVCDGYALGFGHPMLYSGRATMGANTGPSIALVHDPLFGSFEMAEVGDLVGRIDQDRGSGVRAVLGVAPTSAPVTATVRDLDTGASRTGRTDVVMRDWMPDLALLHGIGNLERVIDRYGQGTSTVDVTVRGRTATDEFTYRRANVFASDADIAWDSLLELYTDLWLLQENGVEEVELTSVDVRAAVQEELRRYTITDVEASTDGQEYWPLDGMAELYVPAGAPLHLRVTLGSWPGVERVADLVLDVPADVTGPASLEVRGGPGAYVDPYECMYEPSACQVDGAVDGVADLVTTLEARARNDEVVAALSTWDEAVVGDPPTVETARTMANGDGMSPVAETRARQDRVVTGFLGVPVFVEGSDGGGGEARVERLAGRDRIATAIRASRAIGPEPGMVDRVLLARADDPADALVAAPLAARMGAPLLLTRRDDLPQAVRGEIQRLGASRAVVLGGPQAITEEVVLALRELGLDRVDRIAGTDRYDTARRVALRVGGERVMLARGVGGLTDAVAAAGVAAQQGVPLLLTDGTTLPAPTVSALVDLGATDARVVGGSTAISTSVTQAMLRLDVVVERVAGRDRYATAAALATTAVMEGADPAQLVVATGEATPDGLVAASLAGWRGGVLLLVPGRDAAAIGPARAVLSQVGAPAAWTTVTVVGGRLAVSDAVVAGLVAALPTTTSGDVPAG